MGTISNERGDEGTAKATREKPISEDAYHHFIPRFILKKFAHAGL
jgi:hypothetical protein